jgi:hypothetical protein
MPAPTLVISHPPHGTVDAKRAGEVLDLLPVDVGLKAHYPIPEIWLADQDADAMETAAQRLRESGLRVVVVPGEALAQIPPAAQVGVFSVGERGLNVRSESEETALAYDTPVVGVLFTVRPGALRAVSHASFVHIYAVVAGDLERWAWVPGLTRFTDPAAEANPGFGVNEMAFAGMLETRFARARIDRRLTNMQVRRRTGTPPPGAVRRGYSYAAPALMELLETIQAGLSVLEHPEFCSRLAFLTHAAQ